MTLRIWVLAALLLGGALTLSVVTPTAVPTRDAQAAPATPDFVNGDRFFKEAIAYVANGKNVIHNVTNFFAELEDVRMNWDDAKHEGYLRLWFANPDKYRFELRPLRRSKQVTTKLLVGDKMWVINPTGIQAMHKSAEGARAIQQARKDRERLSDLSRFLTLAGLMGPNVRFDFKGRKRGSGTYEGEWLQVNRIAPDGSVIAFFFAYERNAAGGIVRATYPGVVTVAGDPSKGEPTEDYILSGWRDGPFFRYPSTIQAFAKRGKEAPKRFMLAQTKDLRINAQMPATVFSPPPQRPASKGGK